MAANIFRKISPPLLWGGIGLVILLAGVVAALYYMSMSNGLDSRLEVVTDISQRLGGSAPREEPPAAPPPAVTPEPAPESAAPTPPPLVAAPPPEPAERTHTVLEGENLWSIAKGGDLVDHPWEWRTILMQNRDKVDYAFLSAAGEGGWKVMLREGRELVVRPEADPMDGGRLPGRYVVQVAAVPDRQQASAVHAVDMLLNDGFYAYVSRARVKGEFWNRVRIGFYHNPGEAQEIGYAILDLPKYKNSKILAPAFWVVEAPEAELRGEVLVYGVQRLNPWVIDLPARETHGDALADLKTVQGKGDFTYIYQAQNKSTGLFDYHARVGYFPTYDEAYAALQTNGAMDGARVIEVRNFLEGMPGNRFRFHAITPDVPANGDMPAESESGMGSSSMESGNMDAGSEAAKPADSMGSGSTMGAPAQMESSGSSMGGTAPERTMEVLPSTGDSTSAPSGSGSSTDASASGLAPGKF